MVDMSHSSWMGQEMCNTDKKSNVLRIQEMLKPHLLTIRPEVAECFSIIYPKLKNPLKGPLSVY